MYSIARFINIYLDIFSVARFMNVYLDTFTFENLPTVSVYRKGLLITQSKQIFFHPYTFLTLIKTKNNRF